MFIVIGPLEHQKVKIRLLFDSNIYYLIVKFIISLSLGLMAHQLQKLANFINYQKMVNLIRLMCLELISTAYGFSVCPFEYS